MNLKNGQAPCASCLGEILTQYSCKKCTALCSKGEPRPFVSGTTSANEAQKEGRGDHYIYMKGTSVLGHLPGHVFQLCNY